MLNHNKISCFYVLFCYKKANKTSWLRHYWIQLIYVVKFIFRSYLSSLLQSDFVVGNWNLSLSRHSLLETYFR